MLPHPEPGTWKVRASGRGLLFLVVQATSPVSLGRVQLLARRAAPAGEELVPVLQPARAGAPQDVALSVSGDVQNVVARIVSAGFEDIGLVTRAPQAEGENAGDAPWRGRFIVPRGPFRIVVSGTGPDGRPFVRVHAPLLEAAGR